MLGGMIEMEIKLNIGMVIMISIKKVVHVRKIIHAIGMFAIIKATITFSKKISRQTIKSTHGTIGLCNCDDVGLNNIDEGILRKVS